MKFVAGSAESRRCASKPHGSNPNLLSRTTKLILEIRVHNFPTSQHSKTICSTVPNIQSQTRENKSETAVRNPLFRLHFPNTSQIKQENKLLGLFDILPTSRISRPCHRILSIACGNIIPRRRTAWPCCLGQVRQKSHENGRVTING